MLAGCGSYSISDFLPSLGSSGGKATLQLDSQPQGAQATTSIGPGCKTPCALELIPSGDFTVSFSLDGYQPQTVTVTSKPAESIGYSSVQLAPNPVMAQLEPAPPPQPVKKKRKATKPHTASIKPRPAAEPAPQAQTQPPATTQSIPQSSPSPWPAPPPQR